MIKTAKIYTFRFNFILKISAILLLTFFTIVTYGQRKVIYLNPFSSSGNVPGGTYTLNGNNCDGTGHFEVRSGTLQLYDYEGFNCTMCPGAGFLYGDNSNTATFVINTMGYKDIEFSVDISGEGGAGFECIDPPFNCGQDLIIVNAGFIGTSDNFATICTDDASFSLVVDGAIDGCGDFFVLVIVMGNQSIQETFFVDNVRVTGIPSNLADNIDFDFNKENPFCAGDDVIIEAVIQGCPSCELSWNNGSGQISTENPFVINDVQTSDAGGYLLFVTDDNGCSASDVVEVQVLPSTTPNLPTFSPLCLNDNVVNLPAEVVAGFFGLWSGKGVVKVGNAQVFNPSVAGIGTHTLTYDLIGDCDMVATTTITVGQSGSLVLDTYGPYCLSDFPVPFATTQNGVMGNWDGPGIVDNSFDPSLAGVGMHNIKFNPSDGSCIGADSIVVEVRDKVFAGTGGAQNVCDRGDLTTISFVSLVADAPSLGRFEDVFSTGVDLSDPTSVDFAGIANSTYLFRHIVDGNGTCLADTAEIWIDVSLTPNPGENTIVTICRGLESSFDLFGHLDGSPVTGGLWEDDTNAGVDLSNPSSVDLSGLNAGRAYDFSYNVMNGLCTDFAVLTIAVNAPVTAGMDNSFEFCNTGNYVMDLNSLLSVAPTGRWQSVTDPSININEPTAVPIPANLSGTFLFNYIADSPNVCPNDTAFISLIINALPVAGMDNELNLCISPDLAINFFNSVSATDVTGEWTDLSSSGLDLTDPSNVNISTLTTNTTFSFQYSITQGLCENRVVLTINTDSEQVAGQDSTLIVCRGDLSIFNLENALGDHDDGVWYTDPSNAIDLSDPSFTTLNNLLPGTYIVEHRIADNMTCSGDTAIITIDIIALPLVEDGLPLKICEIVQNAFDLNNALTILTDNSGVWIDVNNIGLDLSNPTATDLSSLLPGEYVLAYEVTNAAMCTSSTTIDLTVVGQNVSGRDTTLSFCQGYSDLINLEAIIGNHDPGYWSSFSHPLVDIIDSSAFDISQLVPAMYIFQHIASNEFVCNEDFSNVMINIEQPTDAGEDAMVSICQGGSLDLATVISGMPDGSFSDPGNSGGLSGSVFNTQLVMAGNYDILYNVANNGSCPGDQATIRIDIVQDVNAGEDKNFAQCQGDRVDLNSIINGDLGGSFVDIDNTGRLQGSVFDPVDLSGQFMFLYVIGDDVVCPRDTATIEVEVSGLPSLNLNETISLCTQDCREIILNWIGTAPFQSTMSLTNGSQTVPNIIIQSPNNQHTITACYNGTTNAFSNDTLYLASNNNSPWTISTILIEDINCAASPGRGEVNLDITLHDQQITNISDRLCESESITVNGMVYDVNRPIGQEIISGQFCDSIVNVNLTFNSKSDSLVMQSLCQGQTLMIGGQTFDETRPSGMILLAGQNQFGCDSTIIVELSFNDIYNMQMDVAICAGDSLFLENAWQFDSGTFTDMYMTEFGCDSIIVTNLTVNSCAVTVVSSSTQNQCFGNLNGTINFLVEGMSFPYTVRWTDETGVIASTSIVGTAQSPIILNSLPMGMYTFIVENTAGDLLYTEIITLTDPPQMNADIQVVAHESCPGANDGSLSVTTSGGTGTHAYTWSNGASTATISNLADGSYSVTVTDQNLCSLVVSSEILGTTAPTINVVKTDSDCSAADNGTIDISVGFPPTPNYQVSLDGMNFQNESLFENLAQGVYDVYVRDNNGCIFQGTPTTILENNDLTIDLVGQATINQGGSYDIDVNVNFTPAIIVWEPAEGLSCSDCLNPSATPTENTIYNVTIEDEFGCSVSSSISLRLLEASTKIYFPNVLNMREGKENYFFPLSNTDIEGIVDMAIFDRWGNKVYEVLGASLQDKSRGWGGLFNNHEVEQGVYVYLIKIVLNNDEVIEKYGDLTVIR